MNSFAIRSAIAASAISILAACGGGSSGGGGTASGPTLNLNAAYSSLIANGSSVAWTLSGDCTGTSVETFLPAYNAFNYDATPVPVLAVDKIQVDTISSTSKALAACNKIYNSNNNEVYADFYDRTTKTIVTPRSDRPWVIYSGQVALPTSVTVGSAGVLFTGKQFDEDTGVVKQNDTVSYSVTADTATTLLITMTNSGTSAATGKTLFTFSNTYRLNANNTLTPLSYVGTTTADLTEIGALSVSATAAAAPAPLNLGTAQNTFLSVQSSAEYSAFRNGVQCGGTASITNTPLTDSNRTRVSSFTNTTDCSSLPSSITTTYGSANQVVSTTTAVNSGSFTNTAKSTPASAALPNNVTVGALGTLYDYTSSNTVSPTGSVTYFVGAATSSTSLTVYEINIQNGAGLVRRNIVATTFNADSTVAPGNIYLDDFSTLIPN
jgi:hypothetical protein